MEYPLPSRADAAQCQLASAKAPNLTKGLPTSHMFKRQQVE